MARRLRNTTSLQRRGGEEPRGGRGSASSTAPNRLHGRVVKGVELLGHDEAMEAGGREFSLHGRVVKGRGTPWP